MYEKWIYHIGYMKNEEQKAVVMIREPARGMTADEMMLRAQEAETEKEIACLYALAHNQAWWVADDCYDFELNTPEYEHARRITEEWFTAADFLKDKIFGILKSEGIIIPERGYKEVLSPFMERNGYYDGRGWWVRKIEKEN